MKVLPRDRRFHYGNYNRYYGYRYHGTAGVDLRLALLRKEWFQGKDCLDIGCNTGQVWLVMGCDTFVGVVVIKREGVVLLAFNHKCYSILCVGREGV